MPEIKYLCYFDTWEKWMDGKLIIGELEFNYDFEDEEDAEHPIHPFSEEGARRHFASKGLPDIQFIYD